MYYDSATKSRQITVFPMFPLKGTGLAVDLHGLSSIKHSSIGSLWWHQRRVCHLNPNPLVSCQPQTVRFVCVLWGEWKRSHRANETFAKSHTSGYATSGCYSHHGMEKVVGLSGVVVTPAIESPPSRGRQSEVFYPIQWILSRCRLRARPAPRGSTFASPIPTAKNSTFPLYQLCDQKP